MPYFTHTETVRERQRSPEVAVRNFHSGVKGWLLERCRRGRCLLDLGAGRGAECRRYGRFLSVTAVDTDAEALAELTRRCGPGHVRTVCRDFCRPLDLGCTFDMVSAFFCCHYAAGRLEEFAANVAGHLRPGGLFVGAALDGEAVLACLRTDRVRTFGRGWARLHLLDDERHLSVTITSISQQPKVEGLLVWAEMVKVLRGHGLEAQATATFRPRDMDEDLAAFSRLHRWWVFRRTS